MRAHLPVVDFALLQQLDQRRPRNVQHVRRFLRRQLRMHGDERHGISARHLFKDAHQQPHRSRRQLYRVARRFAIEYPELHRAAFFQAGCQ